MSNWSNWKGTALNPTRRVLALVAVALMAALSGCGGGPRAQEELKGLHPVRGKIKSNVGSPAGMTVYFFANGTGAHSSSGEVKADGSFELSTRKPGDGATDGDYKVYFSQPIAGKKVPGKLPAKFMSPDTTDVKATITPEASDLGTITLR